MVEWPLICLQCRSALEPLGPDRRRCPIDSTLVEQTDGIWRCLPPDRAAALNDFIADYEAVRRAEGWGADHAAYYCALPYDDLSGRRVDLWRTRARHFRRFVEAVLEPLERQTGRALRILDLGAGNGWLAYRLAQRGHAVAAIDLSVDEHDGLGAHRHYDAAFTPVQAEFDRLPLADDQADLAIFNGALHYSFDAGLTLAEALRVANCAAVIDSPFFADEAAGAAMLAEHRYGRPGRRQPIGFLTGRRLNEVAVETRSRLKMYSTEADPISRLQRVWTCWRIGRAPARFPISVFERGQS